MNVKLLANLRLNSHHNPAIRRNPLRGFFDNLIFRPLRSFSRPSPTEPRCTLMKFVNVGVDNISANCVDCTTNSRAKLQARLFQYALYDIRVKSKIQ